MLGCTFSIVSGDYRDSRAPFNLPGTVELLFGLFNLFDDGVGLMVCVHVVRCCIFLALKVDRVPDELRQQARAIADRYFPQDGEDDDDADDSDSMPTSFQ